MTSDEIQILIADDHPLFRFGLRALLEAEEGTAVIGEATTGEEAVNMAASLQPDVILMDINMPELNGIEATRRILADNPDANILVLTMFDDDTVFAAIRAGARGYLLKGSEGEETLRAIRAVAEKLVLSPKTVRNHVSTIFSKLQVANRAEAIVRAREAGLG